MIDEYEIYERIAKVLNELSDREYIEIVNSVLGTEYTIDDINR